MRELAAKETGHIRDMNRVLTESLKLQRVVCMLQKHLGQLHYETKQRMEIAGRAADECVRVGHEHDATAGETLDAAYPRDWGRRLYDKRCKESGVYGYDLEVYEEHANATIHELLAHVVD